jgi:hypothetical protein
MKIIFLDFKENVEEVIINGQMATFLRDIFKMI